MQTLKEQYDALIAAGMPEVQEFFWRRLIDDTVYPFLEANTKEDDDHLLPEVSARDLVTMHALRWFKTDMTCDDAVVVESYEDITWLKYEIFSIGSDGEVNWGHNIETEVEVEGDILDAIVKAVTA